MWLSLGDHLISDSSVRHLLLSWVFQDAHVQDEVGRDKVGIFELMTRLQRFSFGSVGCGG